MSDAILVLNGPNLNLLGTREPEIYGAATLDDVAAQCLAWSQDNQVTIEFRQTNHEGVLIDWIHEARGVYQGIVINPGGLTHTSVALHDALKGVGLPVIEVHISNIHKREPFRHHSYVSSVAEGVIAGLGTGGYLLALHGMLTLLNK